MSGAHRILQAGGGHRCRNWIFYRGRPRRAGVLLVEVAEHLVADHLPLPIVCERMVALYDNYCREWAPFEHAWAAKPLTKIR